MNISVVGRHCDGRLTGSFVGKPKTIGTLLNLFEYFDFVNLSCALHRGKRWSTVVMCIALKHASNNVFQLSSISTFGLVCAVAMVTF